jgi:hypothetical protein
MEHHIDTLTDLNVSESFQIRLVYSQCPFYVGNPPVPGYLFGIGGYKADGLHFDAHIATLYILLFLVLLLQLGDMFFQSLDLCLERAEVLFELDYGLFAGKETPVSETSRTTALMMPHTVRGVVCLMPAAAFTCVTHCLASLYISVY